MPLPSLKGEPVPKQTACPVCNQEELVHIFSKKSMPKYNLERHFTRSAAVSAECGEIAFYFCPDCLFTFNAAFDQSTMDYSVDYESSRSHSQYFVDYLDQVCIQLNEVLSIRDKTVIEVGCGDGFFLKRLRQMWPVDGYGYDPSSNIDAASGPDDPTLHFVRGYYNSESVDVIPDVLIMRHVLEHQKSPTNFLDQILSKTTVNKKVSLYVEVPAWEWIADNNQFYAFSYEHCSYYTQPSINAIMSKYHYTPKKVSFSFADEYLQYFGTSNRSLNQFNPSEIDLVSRQCITEASIRFAERVPKIIDGLRSHVDGRLSEAVLWGAAGKGTTLLNLLDIKEDQLGYVVDSNPARHGTYIPSTGQQVIPPEFLRKLQPKYVLVTNSNYQTEINAQIKALGLQVELILIDRLIKTF